MKAIGNKESYTHFFEELRNRIIEKGLLSPSPIYGSINIIVSISCYIAGLIFMKEMPYFLVVLYFYILTVELGFISHDLIHNQYFKNRDLNLFFSYISANLLIGLSRSWWMKKHNTEHHTFTNSDIQDSDIRDYDEIFTKNPGKSKFFHTHKRVLFWIVTSVLYFNLIFLSYKHILENRKYGELALNIMFICILPGSLFMNFGVWTGIGMLMCIYILVGVHLAFVFMVNHIGMEIIDGNRIREYAWLDLQTRTSRNIKGGIIINHIFGGLNKQIEHHLFSQASRYNIIKVSTEVKAFCKEKGIQYHDVGFLESIREIYHTLKTGETI